MTDQSLRPSAARPIVPFAVLYLSSFVVTAVGDWLWRPAIYVAVLPYFVGAVGAAAVAVRLLRSGRAWVCQEFCVIGSA